jgi:hypothetical protein
MARRWADDPQWDWLVEHLAEYLEAVRLGKKKEFFEKMTRLFIEKFGIAPSEAAIRALGLEAATKATWDLYSSVSRRSVTRKGRYSACLLTAHRELVP